MKESMMTFGRSEGCWLFDKIVHCVAAVSTSSPQPMLGGVCSWLQGLSVLAGVDYLVGSVKGSLHIYDL